MISHYYLFLSCQFKNCVKCSCTTCYKQCFLCINARCCQKKFSSFGTIHLMYLRLLTLHTLLTILVITIVLTTSHFSSALSEVSKISFYHEVLFDFTWIIFFLHVGIRQEVSQLRCNTLTECLREIDMKHNIQVALDERVASTRHALIWNHHHVGHRTPRIGILGFTLNYLTRFSLDDNISTIKVIETELERRCSKEN